MLYRIDMGYATYGIEIENEVVIEAPPISKWMIGKRGVEVANWVFARQGQMEEVKCQ